MLRIKNKKLPFYAIQGYEGSFHQAATIAFFGNNSDIICCSTFAGLIENVLHNKKCSGGVMAIENSIAGSILPNYSLLLKHYDSIFITGEVYLPIRQHLLVNEGVSLNEIQEIHSHPMAIQQCMDFLVQHRWKLVETEDTALSAKKISHRKSMHVAAIASDLAANIYHLNIIQSDIHTQKNNYTRFLILQKKNQKVENTPSNANKASINFITNHLKGSLAFILGIIAKHNINLSKLQSMPIAGTNFKYSFHADLEFFSSDQFNICIGELFKNTEELRILGIYQNGFLP